MAERRWDVLGVGDVDVNLYLRVPVLPGHDDKVIGEELGEFPGGMVANFCCAASLAGARAALATTVGDDRHGAVAAASLRAAGVDPTLLTVRAGSRTAYCVIFLDDTGEKALVLVKTDLFGPARERVDPAWFAHARLVYFLATGVEQAAWFAAQARAHGALVAIDIEPTTIGADPAAAAALLANVDLVFANEAGLQHYAGGDSRAGADDLLRRGARVVAVTRGAAGCLIATPDETFSLPAYRVPVVDTTGAGDCFNGYFAAGHLRGWSPRRCAEIATAAAANAVTRLGARNGVPPLADAIRFHDEHHPRPDAQSKE